MHPTHDDLVLHYYGESGDEAARLDLHLATCADCRAGLQRLQQALALVEASDEGEPPPGYEATLWARLQSVLDAPAPWWRQPWQAGRWRLAVAGSVAVMAALAFDAGWHLRDVATTPPGTTTAEGGGVLAEEPMRSRLLDLAVGDHLDRAEVVLAELTNSAADEPPSFASERLRASDLVATNRLVRQTAALAGDGSLDGVLDDLERMLIEIANAPDDLTVADWAALKRHIETESLLFRVRVLAGELRARQTPARSLRKGPTS